MSDSKATKKDEFDQIMLRAREEPDHSVTIAYICGTQELAPEMRIEDAQAAVRTLLQVGRDAMCQEVYAQSLLSATAFLLVHDFAHSRQPFFEDFVNLLLATSSADGASRSLRAQALACLNEIEVCFPGVLAGSGNPPPDGTPNAVVALLSEVLTEESGFIVGAAVGLSATLVTSGVGVASQQREGGAQDTTQVAFGHLMQSTSARGAAVSPLRYAMPGQYCYVPPKTWGEGGGREAPRMPPAHPLMVLLDKVVGRLFEAGLLLEEVAQAGLLYCLLASCTEVAGEAKVERLLKVFGDMATPMSLVNSGVLSRVRRSLACFEVASANGSSLDPNEQPWRTAWRLMLARHSGTQCTLSGVLLPLLDTHIAAEALIAAPPMSGSDSLCRSLKALSHTVLNSEAGAFSSVFVKAWQTWLVDDLARSGGVENTAECLAKLLVHNTAPFSDITFRVMAFHIEAVQQQKVLHKTQPGLTWGGRAPLPKGSKAQTLQSGKALLYQRFADSIADCRAAVSTLVPLLLLKHAEVHSAELSASIISSIVEPEFTRFAELLSNNTVGNLKHASDLAALAHTVTAWLASRPTPTWQEEIAAFGCFEAAFRTGGDAVRASLLPALEGASGSLYHSSVRAQSHFYFNYFAKAEDAGESLLTEAEVEGMVASMTASADTAPECSAGHRCTVGAGTMGMLPCNRCKNDCDPMSVYCCTQCSHYLCVSCVADQEPRRDIAERPFLEGLSIVRIGKAFVKEKSKCNVQNLEIPLQLTWEGKNGFSLAGVEISWAAVQDVQDAVLDNIPSSTLPCIQPGGECLLNITVPLTYPQPVSIQGTARFSVPSHADIGVLEKEATLGPVQGWQEVVAMLMPIDIEPLDLLQVEEVEGEEEAAAEGEGGKWVANHFVAQRSVWEALCGSEAERLHIALAGGGRARLEVVSVPDNETTLHCHVRTNHWASLPLIEAALGEQT